MATKQPLKSTFDISHVIRPIFTGGSVAIDNGAQILVTSLGEDAVLTNPTNGKHLAQIEGVRQQLLMANPTWCMC
jgi:U3 small nucleolar RNA-associated protein 13